MSTNILTINPVAVGTNEQVTTSFNFNGGINPDCLEVKNDSPFQIGVTLLGISNQQLVLSPFEHNGWPIDQLVNTPALLGKPITLVFTPTHYYADVATENNSPTNICTV